MSGEGGASCTDRGGRSAFFRQPDDIQKEESSDKRANQRTDDASARNTEQAKYPVANEGTYNPDNQITQQPEPFALHDFPGQEAGDNPDHEEKKQVFCAHSHGFLLLGILLSYHNADTLPGGPGPEGNFLNFFDQDLLWIEFYSRMMFPA
jgi:hypothetical protein